MISLQLRYNAENGSTQVSICSPGWFDTWNFQMCNQSIARCYRTQCSLSMPVSEVVSNILTRLVRTSLPLAHSFNQGFNKPVRPFPPTCTHTSDYQWLNSLIPLVPNFSTYWEIFTSVNGNSYTGSPIKKHNISQVNMNYNNTRIKTMSTNQLILCSNWNRSWAR